MSRMLRFALVLFVLALPAAASAADSTSPPSVVMIIGDDQAWTDYGFMGHPEIRTPNLDRLAREGLVYTRGYVPSSLCRPSLASFITGLYAHQHGITSNDPPGGLARPTMLRQREIQIAHIDRAATLPRLLALYGYLSLQTGKWWEGNYARGGFTHGMTHGDASRGGRHGDEGLKIGREGLEPIFRFIDEAGAQPFFIWYAPMMPHQPHTPPERLLAKYVGRTPSLHVAKFWAMCEWFDETCGQLLDHLDRKSLAKNTIVVYAADNGWIQQPDAPGHTPKSKRSPYDGGLRTPIIVRYPGHVEPGRDETHAVSTIDLAPTILAACGFDAPPGLPGINLADRAAVAVRPAIFGETFTHNAVDVTRPAANLEYRWVLEGLWKLILPNPANVPGGKPELYDVLADPREENDRAAAEPERVKDLFVEIENWWPAK